jgi:hypothetical protein
MPARPMTIISSTRKGALAGAPFSFYVAGRFIGVYSRVDFSEEAARS